MTPKLHTHTHTHTRLRAWWSAMTDRLSDAVARRRFRRHPDDIGLRRSMSHHPAGKKRQP